MSRHYSRFYFRPSYGFMLFAFLILIMSWELQHNDAAVASGHIPQESIRLRILANSDAPADQAVKRVVRDAVVEAMNGWVAGPQTIQEARATLQAHMEEVEQIVGTVLHDRGFEYAYHAELGQVPFPTKIYGSEVYPAGDYEALLITLGGGKGQNWWCVLFPPLCFIDAATGEASAAEAAAPIEAKEASADQKDADTSSVKVSKVSKSDTVSAEQSEAAVNDAGESKAPEAKFFIWEMLQKLVGWLKNLFS